jgi:transposase InsO family protein
VAKKGFAQPRSVHEQWHTDFVHIPRPDSRKILSWGLYERLEGCYAEAVLLIKAKELYPEVNPRVITDNGSQFIWKDFKELITLLEIEHALTSAGHPQSNGKLRGFSGSFAVNMSGGKHI